MIAFIVLGAVLLAWPVKEKISLGLDLQGGMHLVLEVQTDKAVESALEQRGNDIKYALQEDDIEIDRLNVDIENKTLHIILVDTLDVSSTEAILKDYPSLEKQEVRRGGLELVYLMAQDEINSIHENSVEQALETLRNRVDEFGVAEPSLQIQGERRILIQLPGIKNPEDAIELIGQTARLEFKALDESMSAQEALTKGSPPGSEVLYQKNEDSDGNITREPFLVKKKVLLTGDTLTSAEVRYDNQFNEPYVSLTFDSIGAQQFYQISVKYLKKRVAIVLDNHIYSAPVIQEKIPLDPGPDG